MMGTAKRLCSVFKLRIGVAIALSALAGLAASPGPSPEAWRIAILAAAVLVASAAAGAFNQYVERDIDARMSRTRNRPFVTGVYAPGWIWPAVMTGMLAIAVGGAAAALNGLAALYVFLGAFVYGVVYTVWLKRRSWINIVVGGLAGSFAVMAGAAAAAPGLSGAPLMLATVLFLWTPPHFWSLATALRDDYAAAGVPMLPVVVGDARAARVIAAHSFALVALSLAPAVFDLGLGPVYLALAALGGGWFVAKSIALLRNPGRTTAMANFHASLVQLSLLLVGVLVDRLIVG